MCAQVPRGCRGVAQLSMLVAGLPREDIRTGSEGKGSGQVHEERKTSYKQKACVPAVGSWRKLVVCGVCTILWVCHSAPLPLSISLSAHTFVCMCHQLVFPPHQGSVQTGKPHPWTPPQIPLTPLLVANVLLQVLKRFCPGFRHFPHFLLLSGSIFLPYKDSKFL